MKENNILQVLKLIAPGTTIRDGLENILKARTGALILITDKSEVINQVVDGGFKIDDDYSASKLYELAKMDGAIVLSGDCKKILFANAQLIPSYDIPTTETGTRHRTAERTAKQTGELVISISQRRSIITIFKGNDRHVLEGTDLVLNKANQAIKTVERYKKVFDSQLELLNEYELNDIVILENVLNVLIRAEMVMKMSEEVQRKIYELGEDGKIVSLQLEELIGGIENEEIMIVKDYISSNSKLSVNEVMKKLREMDYEDMNNLGLVAKLLGYESIDKYDEMIVSAKGYRILSKVPRMPNIIVENVVKKFENLSNVLQATTENLDDVDGIGEIRAKSIKNSLTRMREQYLFESGIV